MFALHWVGYLPSYRSTQIKNIKMRVEKGLGCRNPGYGIGYPDAYCRGAFKWTFCDIPFVPVQGASQNI